MGRRLKARQKKSGKTYLCSDGVIRNSSIDGGAMFGFRVARLESDVDNVKKDIHEIKVDLREIRKDLTRETTSLRQGFVKETTTLRKEAKTDFRLLFSAIIFVALGLAGIMAKGFHWF